MGIKTVILPQAWRL